MVNQLFTMTWTAGSGASDRPRMTAIAGTSGHIAGVVATAPRNERETHRV